MIGPIFDDYIDNYQCSHQEKAKNIEIFSQNQHKDEKLKKNKRFYTNLEKRRKLLLVSTLHLN
jgi:hypothetical protein